MFSLDHPRQFGAFLPSLRCALKVLLLLEDVLGEDPLVVAEQLFVQIVAWTTLKACQRIAVEIVGLAKGDL